MPTEHPRERATARIETPCYPSKGPFIIRHLTARDIIVPEITLGIRPTRKIYLICARRDEFMINLSPESV